MELNLIRRFVCTIIHVILQNYIDHGWSLKAESITKFNCAFVQNNSFKCVMFHHVKVIDSAFTCMWEPRTRREAEEACLALNYSLIHVTPSNRQRIESPWKSLNNNGNSTWQFTIEFWANHSPDKNRSKGQIQYDMFPSTYDPSDLCVKIVYEVHNTRFGWVPVDCENQTAKAGTCCNQGLLYKARYKALLVLKKTNWYTADHICKEEGGTLFDTNNLIMKLIKVSFADSPWEKENVTDIWSALTLNESRDPEMCTLSRIVPPQPDLFQFSPQLVLNFFDSCEEAKHMSVCMIPSSQLFYSRLKNIILDDDKFFSNTTSRANNTTECMEECNGFNKVGVTCVGFTFDKKSSTCRFSEDRIAPLYRYDPSLSNDVYLNLPITPLIYFEETTTDTFYYTTDFSSITTDITLQHHTSALIHSEETTTDTFYHTTDFSSRTTDKTQQPHTSSIIVIIVAALIGSIASAVVLFYIVGRILAMLDKNMFQEEHRQTCLLDDEIEIPSYDDDEVLYSTNIIRSFPPVSYEGTIY